MQPLIEALELRTLATIQPLAAGIVGPALAYEAPLRLVSFEVDPVGWGGGHYWATFRGVCAGEVAEATVCLYSQAFHLLEDGWAVPVGADGHWAVTLPCWYGEHGKIAAQAQGADGTLSNWLTQAFTVPEP